MGGERSTLSPPPFPIQGKGAALEDISPVAPWEVAQPGQPVKGAEHRRAAAAMPLTGRPAVLWVARRRGINPAELPWTERGKRAGTSGHGVQ